MAIRESDLFDPWVPNVGGPDGKSTIDEVPGASEQTITEIVELFERAAKSATQNVVQQTILETPVQKALE
jgi:hypothetical protein